MQAVAGTGVGVRRDPGRHRQRLRPRGRPAGRSGGRRRRDRRRARRRPPPRASTWPDGPGRRASPLVRRRCSAPASTRSSTSGPTGCGSRAARAGTTSRSSPSCCGCGRGRYTLRLDGVEHGSTRSWSRSATPPATAAACGSARPPTPTDGLLDVVIAGADQPDHADADQAAGVRGHPRRPSGGARATGRATVEHRRRGHHRVRRRRADVPAAGDRHRGAGRAALLA